MNRGRGGRVPRYYPEPRRGPFGDTYSDDHPVRGLGRQDEIQRARSEQDHHVNAPVRSGPQGGFNRNSVAHPSQPTNEPPARQPYGGPRTQSTSASSISPPPSAAGSQPGVSAAITHPPGVGYFPHQPWMYPYPGYPYAFPYIPGYPGVPNPHANPLPPGQSETPPIAPQHATQVFYLGSHFPLPLITQSRQDPLHLNTFSSRPNKPCNRLCVPLVLFKEVMGCSFQSINQRLWINTCLIHDVMKALPLKRLNKLNHLKDGNHTPQLHPIPTFTTPQ